MKAIFIHLIMTAIVLISIASCKDESRQDTFIVRSETTATIGKDGGTIFIPISTTLDYSVTPSASWCSISDKNAIGFYIHIEFNAQVTTRSADITIQAQGFEPFVITVNQDAGTSFFTIDDGQKSKFFEQTGGTLPVSFSTNQAYTVVSDETWCEISNPTNSGFIITVGANSGIKRSAILTITVPGLSDILIRVTQSGGNILLNGDFKDGFNHWTISGTPNLFELADYQIFGVIAKTVGRQWAIREADYEGWVMQEVTGIPDGSYLLTCTAAGAGYDFDLCIIDKDGVETRKKIEIGAVAIHTMEVNITGGQCSVGFHVKKYRDISLWWNTTNFILE